MDGLIFYDMEVEHGGLSLDGDLIATVFFDAFVEALDLKLGQVVVESDAEGRCQEKEEEQTVVNHIYNNWPSDQ